VDTDIDLLRRLGGLHDARVEEIVWRKADRSLRLTIADMFSHVAGLPEYAGPASGTVIFVGIDGLAVETALFKGAFRISGIDVDTRGDGLEVRIGLSEPGSVVRLLCREIRVTVARRGDNTEHTQSH